MEEEKRETTAPECRKNNDLRTFVIALLTAVIVVAVYHFGVGVCKIYCPDGSSTCYPTRRYMLVPVMESPMHGMDEGAMHRPGRGKFGARRPGNFREGGVRPDWKRGPAFGGRRPGNFREGGMRPDWKRGPAFDGRRPAGQFGPRGEFKGPKGFSGPNGPKKAPAKADAPETKQVPEAKPAAAPAADAKPAPAPAR